MSPRCRGLKIGKALFGHLALVAKEKDCPRLDWSVLKWNTPSIEFYQKALNALSMDEWMGMRLVGDGIEKLMRRATLDLQHPSGDGREYMGMRIAEL